MIWSTRYLMDSTASTHDKAAPLRAAAPTPIQPPTGAPRIWKSFSPVSSDETSTATKAPPSSMPSMAMLMTATRSHRTPDSAPSVIGTLRTMVACSIPMRLKDPTELWAVAHPRKANTKRMKPKANTRLDHLPNPRANWIPPSEARTAETANPMKEALKVTSGKDGSWARASPKVASPSPTLPKAKAQSTKTADNK